MSAEKNQNKHLKFDTKFVNWCPVEMTWSAHYSNFLVIHLKCDFFLIHILILVRRRLSRKKNFFYPPFDISVYSFDRIVQNLGKVCKFQFAKPFFTTSIPIPQTSNEHLKKGQFWFPPPYSELEIFIKCIICNRFFYPFSYFYLLNSFI